MSRYRTDVAVESTQILIKSTECKERNRMKKSDFSRNRKLSFAENVMLILHASKKSLQTGLNMFLEEIGKAHETYSKQAFSKGRMRINPNVFVELFKMVCDIFYDYGSYERYKGYRVMAIDGTRYNLPGTEELQKEYGMQRSTNQVQALGSCLYDVLNGIVIDAAFAPHNSSERDLAEKHLEELCRKRTEKDVVLFDRGYPSAKLIKSLNDKGIKYVMRFSKEFLNKVKISGDDCIIEHTFASTGITAKIRILTVDIGNNMPEMLISNIYDEDFSAEDFKELYHMRWGIEEKYKDLKLKLETENFSGISNIAIQQDYYATIYLSNMAALMIADNKDKIKKYNKNSNNKHQYKQNLSQTISELKLNLIKMLLEPSARKRNRMLKGINKRLEKALIPIREGRSYTRERKHFSNRFPNNRKSL